MTEADRELMQRYIYQVTRRLAKDQREETARELEELITDMAEQKGMEEALKELGDPAVFAQKYREEPGWVIGPEYAEDYRWLLKIVLAAVALSVVVSGVVQGALQRDGAGILTEAVSSAVTGALSAVGAVTVLFMILERRKIRVDFRKEFRMAEANGAERRKWVPMLLPPVPDSKAEIKRSDEAVNLIFEALLAGLMIFAPWLFGAYAFENGTFIRTIPIFNLERWNIILPVLLISLAAGFADDVVRLVCGCYCRTVLIICLISGAVQAVFAWILLKGLPFFNPSFVQELRQEFDWQGTKGDLLTLYGTGRLETIVLLVIWACILIETGVTVYKTVRYAEKG
ncbi:MAG TPA: hypothetical protein H9831_04135 [Candidatus Eisenbergiella pullistercoris]|uniref:Uncharacterized protein n=1 Tax=Candidatus Eisenbergiella pullistercoris TaxID=2838555 RepID=A0A9D2C6E0_9FIRM|nr:hypothetical protein [Candidatus Eisenbergiella pullistercoris]